MPMRVVVALYTYDPTTMSPNVDAVQEELPFQEGQIIKIFGECDPDGFYLGECNGLRGLVPSNMVSKPENEASRRAVNKALADKSAGNIGNRLETGTIPPGQRSKPRSTESMNPRRHRIPALPDDPVEYMETNQQTHSALFTDATECGPPCRARIRRSADQPLVGHRATVNGQSRLQFGSVPTARHESAQRPSSSRSRPNDSAKQQGIGWRQHMNLEKRPMLAVYDYDPSVLSPNADADEMELSFRTGDMINVYGGMDEDGFYYGETEDGRRGLVPSNFLREIAESTDERHTLPDSRENRSYLNMDQTRASGFSGRYNSQGASSIEEDGQSRNENVQHHRTSVSSS
ncbi:unnamed protein product [Dicrocoelium dendriticum]|nr:unnamed protein product [Dicrocoelium dendriticum]